MQPKELVKCMGTCINVIHSTVARLARKVTVGDNIIISWPPYKSSIATMWSPLLSSWQSMVVAASPEAEAMPACGEDKQYHMPQLGCECAVWVCVLVAIYNVHNVTSYSGQVADKPQCLHNNPHGSGVICGLKKRNLGTPPHLPSPPPPPPWTKKWLDLHASIDLIAIWLLLTFH